METSPLIQGFKKKFEKFIFLYRELKLENQRNLDEIEVLKQALYKKDEEIEQLKYKLDKNDLANSFLKSGENSRNAKNEINKIVREIDNCIALLNR